MDSMITYKFKSQTKNGYITFTGDKIQVRTLKKQIALKSGSKQQQLVLDDEQTNERYKDSDFVKSFSVVVVERVNPLSFYASLQNQSMLGGTGGAGVGGGSAMTGNPKGHSDAVHEMLESLAEKARFFMIKSSNQDNIRIAKQHGIWATTFINQRKLKDAFDDIPNILLFFKANSSNNLQGLARMQQKPSDTPNKTVWIGVQTIKLGGNFRIKWLSKSIVSGSKFQHEINPITKEYVSRSGDVQEIERGLGKRMAYLFDLPSEPELSSSIRVQKEKQESFINIEEILKPGGVGGGSGRAIVQQQSVMPSLVPSLQPSLLPGPMGIYPPHVPAQLFAMFRQMNEMMYMNMKNREAEETKPKEKSRAKSARSSSSDSSSSSSESERSRKKKHKKDKKRKDKKSRKDRKEKRSRSRSRNRKRERSHHKKRK